MQLANASRPTGPMELIITYIPLVVIIGLVYLVISWNQKQPTTPQRELKDSIRNARGQPSGTYLRWPVPAFWVLLLLGIGGAVAGGGKTAEGFLAAFALNPIVWGAAYSFSQIGRIRCPHCRKSSPLKGAAKYPVGAAITCDHCGNNFAKPLG